MLAVERKLGVPPLGEGEVRVTFNDSIITGTTAEKRQDMDEVTAELMGPWEYRTKWYGEDEAPARRLAMGPNGTGSTDGAGAAKGLSTGA